MEVEQLYNEKPTIVCPLYESLADTVLAHYDIASPINIEEALTVFFVLIQTLHN